MIKIWLRNIIWLFNHPPVSITQDSMPKKCHYCEQAEIGVSTWTTDEYTICTKCQKKVYDKVLK